MELSSRAWNYSQLRTDDDGGRQRRFGFDIVQIRLFLAGWHNANVGSAQVYYLSRISRPGLLAKAFVALLCSARLSNVGIIQFGNPLTSSIAADFNGDGKPDEIAFPEVSRIQVTEIRADTGGQWRWHFHAHLRRFRFPERLFRPLKFTPTC